MIAQWDSSLPVLPVARVRFPAIAEYFKGLSLVDHTLPTRSEPAWQKMDQYPFNGAKQPVEIEEEGRSPTTNRQWLR